MDLVRDVLDKKVVDRHGRDMGRVDGLVLHATNGRPPRVSAIEVGPAVLGHRLLPLLGRCVSGIEHALGIDRGRPLRIPFRSVLDITDQVKVDLAFGETSAATVELRLRRWVGALPLSS